MTKYFLMLGRSLMLPIAVLPIAGILLRLGQPDILELFITNSMSHDTLAIFKMISEILSKSGSAVFDNLPVIFAIGIAIGFACDHHGAVALASFIGHSIFISVIHLIDNNINMGVLSGILIGSVSGMLYNKYYKINLPTYLAFFGGRRFISIISGITALILACIVGYIWLPIQNGIALLGNWIISSGDIGLFLYGFANRMLVPLGLHHILNTLVWFTFGDYTVIENGISVVKHGDLWRFFAQDPKAGYFMAGSFPPLMFGLPGAAMAMILCVKKERRNLVIGVLASSALTAFLTGITEPIEFSFLFLAFPLYVVHALLVGISFVIMHMFEVRLGFTFSAGLFDYLLSYGLGQNGWKLLIIGPIYFAVYFMIFYIIIKKFNILTPGRDENEEFLINDVNVDGTINKTEITSKDKSQKDVKNSDINNKEVGTLFIESLGGKDNIMEISNCATRLRLKIKNIEIIDKANLKKLGAKGVISKRSGETQVIIGPEVESVAEQIKESMKKM